MKTVLTAAFLTALALLGTARSSDEEEVKKAPEKLQLKPAKPLAKLVTLAELEPMLVGLGFEPKPAMNKEGKQTGHEISVRSGTWVIIANVELSPNGKNIWISGTVKSDIDATAPVEAVLAVLELNHKIFPAYITYFPKTKTLWLGYRLLNTDVTPVVLRDAIDAYTEAVKNTLTAWDQGVASAKQKVGTNGAPPAPRP